MMLLLGLAGAVALTSGAEVADRAQCAAVLRGAGMSERMNETIAHAVHSMTVESLRMFNPDATEKNGIPTVKPDLSGSVKVLAYAPAAPLPEDFATDAMNMVDKILTDIGSPRDGLGPNWSSVERIAHAFHMRDLWVRIRNSKHWEAATAAPPGADVCSCLLDVEGNGVAAGVAWVAKHYESGTPITLLNRAIPKLVDSSSWAVWRARLLHYYDDASIRDAAMYLSCATQ